MTTFGPYEIDSIVTGDALALTRQLPDGCVDLTITSPPYNLGNDHHTGNIRHRQYSDDLPEGEYQQQQIDVLTELYRATSAGGSVLYNHKNRIKNGQTLTPYAWLLRTPWVLKQEIVWFNRSQNFDKIRFFPMTERVYWLAKSTQTQLVNTIGHHDVFEWQAVGTSGIHTRAFPEQFVRDMLACFPAARVVLDLYAGSGTVAAVCKQLGRHWLGFEIDPQTADKARRRIADTQPPLFVETEALEQPSMFELTA